MVRNWSRKLFVYIELYIICNYSLISNKFIKIHKYRFILLVLRKSSASETEVNIALFFNIQMITGHSNYSYVSL